MNTSDEPDEQRDGYWAAFGYQNHVIPTEDPRRDGPELIALCGVMTEPADLSPRDDRPTCSVCAGDVRSGRISVIHVMSG